MPYNSEGLRNHHRGDGTNHVMLDGDEYHNIWPAFDMQKIPGTTVMQGDRRSIATEGGRTLDDARWILHNGIGYVFPTPTRPPGSPARRTGGFPSGLLSTRHLGDRGKHDDHQFRPGSGHAQGRLRNDSGNHRGRPHPYSRANIGLSVPAKLDGNGDNFSTTWNENTRASDLIIDLPQGPEAGRSVTIRF